jgi:hypothetical protein
MDLICGLGQAPEPFVSGLPSAKALEMWKGELSAIAKPLDDLAPPPGDWLRDPVRVGRVERRQELYFFRYLTEPTLIACRRLLRAWYQDLRSGRDICGLVGLADHQRVVGMIQRQFPILMRKHASPALWGVLERGEWDEQILVEEVLNPSAPDSMRHFGEPELAAHEISPSSSAPAEIVPVKGAKGKSAHLAATIAKLLQASTWNRSQLKLALRTVRASCRTLRAVSDATAMPDDPSKLSPETVRQIQKQDKRNTKGSTLMKLEYALRRLLDDIRQQGS